MAAERIQEPDIATLQGDAPPPNEDWILVMYTSSGYRVQTPAKDGNGSTSMAIDSRTKGTGPCTEDGSRTWRSDNLREGVVMPKGPKARHARARSAGVTELLQFVS